jgi:hypothetical protein
MTSMETDVLCEACDILYPFMHPSSLVSKYNQRYRQNATARSPPGSILPTTKDRSSTSRYSHSMCKHEFNVKLAICSIHLCIHHHLDRNTEQDMDWMVPRLLHDDALLLVAYQLTMSSLPTIFIQPMQTCIQHEAVGLLYPFVHSVSPVFKYEQRYGSNSLQATTRAHHCSTPTNNNNVHHTQKYS